MTLLQEIIGMVTLIIMGFIPGLMIGAQYHRQIMEDDKD